MKKISLIILTIILSANCIAQNRFTQIFSDADHNFEQEAKKAAIEAAAETNVKLRIDKYENIWKIILSDTTLFESSVNELMLSYVSGYMNGIENVGRLQDVNFDAFLSDVIQNKNSIQSYARIKKQKNNGEIDVFLMPYTLKIIDEHEVQCISSSGEKISLYFENAYRLSDEWCVYIKK